VQRLGPALALVPEPLTAGLALLDEERGLWMYHAQHAGRAALEAMRDPGRGGWKRAVSTAAGAIRSSRTSRRRQGNAFQRALATRGVRTSPARRSTSARASVRDRVPRRCGHARGERLAYLGDLARIVEPHAWNCLTDLRLSRGDAPAATRCASSVA
jgi:hypothetical protein